ncbi:hypothetical protein, partial [Acrocarpospora corrugata]|uniref:hypothetical protein n=2 Tax=Acrocarpospora corrugata TaxID=35763 RepID=UPI0031DEC8F1
VTCRDSLDRLTMRELRSPWAATFVVSITTSASAADDPQWSMGGQNISNTRSNPTETILSPSTADDLLLNWTYTTRGDVSATPAVVDGAVYSRIGAGSSTRWTRTRAR